MKKGMKHTKGLKKPKRFKEYICQIDAKRKVSGRYCRNGCSVRRANDCDKFKIKPD